MIRVTFDQTETVEVQMYVCNRPRQVAMYQLNGGDVYRLTRLTALHSCSNITHRNVYGVISPGL